MRVDSVLGSHLWRLGWRSKTVLHHVRLEDSSLQVHAVHLQGRKLRHKHLLRNLSAHLDAVVAVRNDLWLNNWHQALALADGSVVRQVVHALKDRKVRWEALGGIDLQHVAPLREARALSIGFLAALLEVL